MSDKPILPLHEFTKNLERRFVALPARDRNAILRECRGLFGQETELAALRAVTEAAEAFAITVTSRQCAVFSPKQQCNFDALLDQLSLFRAAGAPPAGGPAEEGT